MLGHIGDDKVVTQVIELLQDDSINVRNAAIQALGDLNDDRAVKPLVEIAKNDPEQEVRQSAFRVLRELASGSQLLFDIAIAALDDTSPDVRVQATRILGDFKDERAIDPLLRCLSNQSWSVRFSAENSLYSQGKRVVPDLIQILLQDSLLAKRRAISALGRIGDPQAIKPIEKVLAKETDRITISKATDALKLSRGETARSVGI